VSGKIANLPNRFPVGTRFVIEGLGGRISSRFIEFPDGRKVNLPAGSPGEISKQAKEADAKNMMQ
jgi:hypothetical protein